MHSQSRLASVVQDSSLYTSTPLSAASACVLILLFRSGDVPSYSDYGIVKRRVLSGELPLIVGF